MLVNRSQGSEVSLDSIPHGPASNGPVFTHTINTSHILNVYHSIQCNKLTLIILHHGGRFASHIVSIFVCTQIQSGVLHALVVGRGATSSHCKTTQHDTSDKRGTIQGSFDPTLAMIDIHLSCGVDQGYALLFMTFQVIEGTIRHRGRCSSAQFETRSR